MTFPQSNETFYQGTLVGFMVCFVVLAVIIYFFSRQYISQQKKLTSQLAKSTEKSAAMQHAHQLLLQELQQSQEQLEERVQERTLELHITLQELEEANRELEQKNTIDELSGLFNRRFYDQKILAEYRRSKRNLTPLSLVLIDIDHFKQVNDTYGHLAGDQCLKWLSKQIKQSLKRSSDTAFRYGGEEFCLVLPNTEAHGAMTLAQTLRQQIEQHVFQYENTDIPITISCGVSTYVQQKNVQPEQLFASADKALYQAKHDGRNQVQAYQFIEE